MSQSTTSLITTLVIIAIVEMVERTQNIYLQIISKIICLAWILYKSYQEKKNLYFIVALIIGVNVCAYFSKNSITMIGITFALLFILVIYLCVDFNKLKRKKLE